MANITDYFTKAKDRWTGQIGSGGVADSAVTTIPLASSTGLPTDTAIYLAINRVDANGEATPSKFEVVKGVIVGDNLTTATRGVEGTAQAHSAGAVVEFLMTAAAWNSLITGLLVEHNQDGTHNIPGMVTEDGEQTLTNKTLTDPVLNGDLTGDAILDEDDMASDSDTKVPTQQSVKAYVEDAVGGALALVSITQTNLASGFTAASGTAEQEVTGLRVSLPIVPDGTSCTVKILLKVYWTTVSGDNTLRIRLGTSTSYLTNTERDNLYVPGIKTIETFTAVKVISDLDLTEQNFVVVSVQNGTNANGMTLSASQSRSTIVVEVYK